MRTIGRRLATWCCLLVALLMMSGCFSDPPTPSKKPTGGPDWQSVKTTKDLPDVTIERVTYRSGNLTVQGQICRPTVSGRHPVLISNHGGFAGILGLDDPNGFCATSARSGWVVAESSYRGEDGSDGDVEVCLGEVDDVMAMIDVVRQQPYVDSERVAMLGVSHGGCVTSRAVERGADVDLVAMIAGPADWKSLMRAVKRSMKAPSTTPLLQQILEGLVDSIEKAVGGTVEQYPKRYAERSPDAEKLAQWDKPFLIMHGAADTIVPVQQSCTLARKIGGFRAFRLDTSGGVVPASPPGCEDLTWNEAPSPVGTFKDDRYLMVFDDVDHFLVANNGLSQMTTAFFQFLEAKLPG
jgi:poly(3-hydroxybutyrate) depolymerase